MQQLQTNNATFLGRHWHELEVLRRLKPNDGNLSILSFGCSTGEELLTTKLLFPRAALFGCDIDWASLQRARSLLREKATVFHSSASTLAEYGPYDIILCNSVLLRHTTNIGGRRQGIDPQMWVDTVRMLDGVLKPGGLFQIINSNIPFRCHPLAAQYAPIRSETLFGANFVDLFDLDGGQLCRGVGGYGWLPLLTRHLEAEATERLQPHDLHDTHFWKSDGGPPPPPICDEVLPNLPTGKTWATGSMTYRPHSSMDGSARSTHVEVDVLWTATSAGTLLLDRTMRRVWFDGSVPITHRTRHEATGAEATAMIEASLGRRPVFISMRNALDPKPIQAPMLWM